MAMSCTGPPRAERVLPADTQRVSRRVSLAGRPVPPPPLRVRRSQKPAHWHSPSHALHATALQSTREGNTSVLPAVIGFVSRLTGAWYYWQTLSSIVCLLPLQKVLLRPLMCQHCPIRLEGKHSNGPASGSNTSVKKSRIWPLGNPLVKGWMECRLFKNITA